MGDIKVANSPQAKKRARQAEKRRSHNASLRSLVRTNIKKVLAAIDSGDAEQAQAAYAAAVPVIERKEVKRREHNMNMKYLKCRKQAEILRGEQDNKKTAC